MGTATMTIRCDAEIKEEAAKCAKYYGFDLTSVTRAFWTYLARNWSIPLKFGEEPIEESLRAIQETKEMLAGEREFESFENPVDMFKTLGI